MMVHRTITFYGEEAEVISIAMKQKDARVSELEALYAILGALPNELHEAQYKMTVLLETSQIQSLKAYVEGLLDATLALRGDTRVLYSLTEMQRILK